MRRLRDTARRLAYLRERWPRPFGTRPPIALAVCAIFRDEARYLAEWVSFHRIQGVERFYLYDNRSSDDWATELAPEIEAGIVEVQHWPFVPGQLGAYKHCLEQHRDEARWIAFIDVDEFLFSPTGRPVPDVLRGFDTHSGVVVNWRMYGTSGHKDPPRGPRHRELPDACPRRPSGQSLDEVHRQSPRGAGASFRPPLPIDRPPRRGRRPAG